MSWFSTVVVGAFGFMFGGPLGAILGASVGHRLSKGWGATKADVDFTPSAQYRAQMAFFTATFSVMGHIAKADGRVCAEEISQANRVMDEMALATDMRTSAINLFEQGKQAHFPLNEVLAQFYKECQKRSDLIRLFLEFQLKTALADGTLTAIEERLLLHICNQLRITRFDYARLKIQLQAQQRSHQQDSYTQKAPPKTGLQAAYGVLGLTPAADKIEVKKAYRRLMSQNHPDKLVAQDLPEELMRLAKEKTQKIAKAYETIQKTD